MMSAITEKVRIWDPFIRLFHWTVATLFLLDFWVLEDGDPPHEWAGYVVGGLVALRLVWGFFGPHNARFASFFPTPKRVKQHVTDLKNKQLDPTEGHNPLGGAMVIALLLMLGVVSFSGWMLNWDRFWGVDWVEELHETSANITMIMVVIHVSAVVLIGRLTHIPLIGPMITGKRRVVSK